MAIRNLECASSVLSQKFVEEVSPDVSGRKNVAHGVSRGSASPPLPPSPLPLGRERGAEGGVRAVHPRACALGYNLPPLTGLRKGRPHEEDFVSELLTQQASNRLPHAACCLLLSYTWYLTPGTYPCAALRARRQGNQ